MKNYKHQDIAIQRFKHKEYFGLLFDCGTGKTATAIQIADVKDKPVIVIAPANILKQWATEFEKISKKEVEWFMQNTKKKNTKKYQKSLTEFIDK